jgi:hypothetical protein
MAPRIELLVTCPPPHPLQIDNRKRRGCVCVCAAGMASEGMYVVNLYDRGGSAYAEAVVCVYDLIDGRGLSLLTECGLGFIVVVVVSFLSVLL